MSTANIVFLINLQNGFIKKSLSKHQGGSFYIPGSEDIGEIAARLIRNMSNATIILSQHYHPANHISFASQHLGASLFSNIRLRLGTNGIYSVATTLSENDLDQTLWPDHCIQGTESALFADEIMDALPTALKDKLFEHSLDPSLRGFDGHGNIFHIIRSGMRPDLYSYGVVTENDGISITTAPDIFEGLIKKYRGTNVTSVRIYIGGLATNFGVEFSHKDIWLHLVPKLKALGIKTEVSLLTDLSRGILYSAHAGEWPDLKDAPERMKAFGTSEITTDTAIRQNMFVRQRGTRQLLPHLS